jgi:hypothetical protein
MKYIAGGGGGGGACVPLSNVYLCTTRKCNRVEVKKDSLGSLTSFEDDLKMLPICFPVEVLPLATGSITSK